MHFQSMCLIQYAYRSIIAVVLLLCTPAYADFQGKVINVIDGDTIDVLVNLQAIRVRLADIDAPELGQPFSQRARRRLSGMILHQKVEIIETGTDRYGRTLGTVYAKSNDPGQIAQLTNINAVMVKGGTAWANRYKGELANPQMYVLENEARRQRRGLWSDPNAQEPWEWRRKSKNR
ncbi:thermonuclease family protein [Advenella mimigardefordensis]|uniref:Putative nuclease n=1 Tax=Advenella mimigardefordensis (strain DSM 17166 / LMG 22922 / DPN7) TaxID=1247726 RepID=W0P823_ADVMD|nr:thermonuclease family protein [Advenella mimigardefordensis]AHG62876.1 putative nuclease [Advenella mimigardefordensis DPN7]